VPLPPIVLNSLREWKLACTKTDLDLVFPSKYGRVEHHATVVRRGLAPVQVAAGVTVAGRDKDGAPIVRAQSILASTR
jgi:integrase